MGEGKYIKFSEGFESWIKEREKSGISPLTIRHLRSDCRRLTEGSGECSKKALLNMKTVVRSVEKWAEKNGFVVLDMPDIGKFTVSEPKTEGKTPKTWTLNEWDRLHEYVFSEERAENVYALSIALLMETGLKVSELRALTWEDYKCGRTLYVSQKMVQRKCEEGLKYCRIPIKKGGEPSPRQIYLTEDGEFILKRLRKINRSKKYICNSRGNDPISGNRLNEYLKGVCERIGIKPGNVNRVRYNRK